MGFISPNAKWYLAEIVLQIAVEGDPRFVVHTNMVLVRADSPDDAYIKATELGITQESSYQNPADKLVTFTFRGLRDLNAIHEELEHGAELIYSEQTDMDEAAIQKWISVKEDLGVFAPRKPSSGPNYASKDVIRQLREEFPSLDLGDLDRE